MSEVSAPIEFFAPVEDEYAGESPCVSQFRIWIDLGWLPPSLFAVLRELMEVWQGVGVVDFVTPVGDDNRVRFQGKRNIDYGRGISFSSTIEGLLEVGKSPPGLAAAVSELMKEPSADYTLDLLENYVQSTTHIIRGRSLLA